MLNSLTGADVLTENKLFATLDPTTRRLRLPTNQNVLLTDTVGFIRKLPHSLVDAFKAQVTAAVLVFRTLTFILQIPLGAITYVIWQRKKSWRKPVPHEPAEPEVAAAPTFG